MGRLDIDDPEVSNDLAGRITYQGALYTGEAVEYGPNGVVVGLWTYVDGVGDGPDRAWYPDGSPESEGLVRNGAPFGEWTSWHPNGQLRSRKVFDANGLVSQQEWADDGTPV